MGHVNPRERCNNRRPVVGRRWLRHRQHNLFMEWAGPWAPETTEVKQKYEQICQLEAQGRYRGERGFYYGIAKLYIVWWGSLSTPWPGPSANLRSNQPLLSTQLHPTDELPPKLRLTYVEPRWPTDILDLANHREKIIWRFKTFVAEKWQKTQ